MHRRSALLALASAALSSACADDPELCPRGPATCPGARAPSWSLRDAQPKSPRFGQSYGLDALRGRTTVLVLVDTLCGSCGPVAAAMDVMQRELLAEGVDVAVHGLVRAFDAPSLERIVEKVSYPLLVDEPSVDAWGQQGGGASDTFVYGRNGLLLDLLSVDDGRLSFAAIPSGYARVKASITRAASLDAPRRLSPRGAGGHFGTVTGPDEA